jgi:wyosine [tRNA(Phe)-imidazoG37] synthetase (radical SAM superfamily)
MDNPPKQANKQGSHHKYVFGPVPSRRLGWSLGIDLIPFKTCTYDCIYCQLGRTTNQTLERRPYVRGKRVIQQLQENLRGLSSPPDYITFSGSGEPTLNSEVGWVIEELKKLTRIPIAILTNGSLLHLGSVRKALLAADLVIPSLDAGTSHLSRFINRPHPSLRFSRILRGLREFCRESSGQVWLEVMLCGGFNDNVNEICRLREEIEIIGPDKIQLNTVIRPPAEDYAKPLSPARMEEMRLLFSGRAEVLPRECTAPPSRVHGRMNQEILALLERRPCSLQDLSRAFGVPEKDMAVSLRKLRDKGTVGYDVHDSTIFFRAGKKSKRNLSLGR